MRALDLPRQGQNITPVNDILRKSAIRGLRFEPTPNARVVRETPSGPGGESRRIEYRLNAFGGRGAEIPRRDPARYRIAVFGDSFTFGAGVAEEETFVARLDAALNDGADRPCDVLNLGVPRFSTREEVMFMRHLLPGLDPDLVILVMFLNDARGGAAHSAFNAGFGADGEPSFLARTSRIWRAILMARNRERAIDELIESYRQSFAAGSAGWLEVTGALAQAQQMVERRGARLALAVFPVLYRLDGGYPWREVHERLGRHARSLGLPVLDLLPAFLGRAYRDLWVHATNQHPNAAGHAIAAEALLPFVKSLADQAPR